MEGKILDTIQSDFSPKPFKPFEHSELGQVVPLISLCDKNQNLKLNAAAK